MTGNASKFWGVVLTLSLTGMSLAFLVGVMGESRLSTGPEGAFAIVAAGAIFYALLRGPVGKAIGKMLEGHAVPDEQAQRTDLPIGGPARRIEQ